MNRPEQTIQRSIVDYLRTVLPTALVFAIPNAASRTKNGKASNGVPGLTAGIPDLALILPGGKAHFIECKTPIGSLSDEQQAIRYVCLNASIPWAVATSIDDVRIALDHWNISTNEVRA